MELDFLQRMTVPAKTKIVMLIMDGLGGLPREAGGLTALETAHTPNLDALALRSALGLTVPVRPGITAGSGPGHLGIFGYDPVTFESGRGALESSVEGLFAVGDVRSGSVKRVGGAIGEGAAVVAHIHQRLASLGVNNFS